MNNTPKWVNSYIGLAIVPYEVRCPKCWTVCVDIGRCSICQDTEIHPCPFSEVWEL